MCVNIQLQVEKQKVSAGEMIELVCSTGQHHCIELPGSVKVLSEAESQTESATHNDGHKDEQTALPMCMTMTSSLTSQWNGSLYSHGWGRQRVGRNGSPDHSASSGTCWGHWREPGIHHGSTKVAKEP